VLGLLASFSCFGQSPGHGDWVFAGESHGLSSMSSSWPLEFVVIHCVDLVEME